MRTRTSRGFSLVELVVVLVVIGVVFSIAITKNGDAVFRTRTKLVEDRIAKDIRLADQDAWYSGTVRQIVFDVPNNKYSITGMTDAAGNPYVVDVSKSPYNLSLAAVDFAGSDTITLDGRGTAISSGTVTLQGGSKSVVADVEVQEKGTVDVLDVE